MAVDPLGRIIALKNGYSRMRGADPSIGKKRPDGKFWMVPGKSVPRTTWLDAFIATANIEKNLGDDRKKCVSAYGLNPNDVDLFNPKHAEVAIACNFVRTDSYKAAKQLFDSVKPKIGVLTGAQLFNAYPKNEEFWGAAMNYAIARSAAGVVPHWYDLTVESIAEAAKELPGNLASFASKLNPKNLLPDLSPLADIIKWGSIGGGLFLLYWYVLRPKKS